MNLELLKKQWLSEEHAAHIHGWDFYYPTGRVENNRELVELLLNEIPPLPFSRPYLHKVQKAFEKVGFVTLKTEKVYRPIKFWNVDALVWFARIIEWEFPDFDVKKCLNNLYHAQEILEEKGAIEGRIHRFLYVAKK